MAGTRSLVQSCEPTEPVMEKPKGFFQGTEMPNAGWWQALWPDPAGVLGKVGIKSGMLVVDLCSGDGWFTLQIAKIARRVVAIEIDPALLEVGRHRVREATRITAISSRRTPTKSPACGPGLWISCISRTLSTASRISRAWRARSAIPSNLWDDSPSSIGMGDLVKKQLCWASRADRAQKCECRRNRQSMYPRSMGLNFTS